MVLFTSLEQILAKLEQQPGWQQFRQYRQLLECWQKIVAPDIAKHTKPLYIQRQILWVATSSSTRAQELSFQRYYLLKKLNSQLNFYLKDIRFSANKLNLSPSLPINSQQIKNDRAQNYYLNKNKIINSRSHSSSDPQLAVLSLINKIKSRQEFLLSCPQCKSSTPEEELKRWGLCHHCIAQKWSLDYRKSNYSRKS